MQMPQDDFDIATLLASIRRNLRGLTIAAMTAGALTYGVLWLLPPTYKSTAQIILEPSSSSLLRPRGQDSAGNGVKVEEGEVASQVEVMRSRDLLQKVAAAEHLDLSPEYNANLQSQGIVNGLLSIFSGLPAGMSLNERMLDILQQNLRIGEVPKTRLINIDATAHDSALAARLANALAQAYLEGNRSSQIKDASDATTWLGSSIQDVKQQAEAADAALERFRAESGLLSGQNNVTLNAQRLSELNTQLTQASAARTEAEARSRIIRDMLASGQVESSQDVVKSANMQQLFQQKLRVERDIAELSAILLPAHPRMRQLSAQLAIVNDGLRQEARLVAAGIEDDGKVASAREAALQASIARLTETQLKSSDAQARLGSLEREAQSTRNTYESLLQRLSDASNHRDRASVSALAGLNERASPSSIPDSPRKLQMTLFATAGVFLLGLVSVITRAIVGGPSRGLGRASARAAIGAMPLPPQAEEHTSRATETAAVRVKDGESLARFVAGRLTPGGSCRTLLTGEAEAQEIVPVATDLARRLARSGSTVVLVDWTFPSASSPLSASGKQAPGLFELINGAATFEEALQPDPHGSWHRIGPGAATGGRSLRDRAANLESVFDALGAVCQHVIVVASKPQAKDVLEALDGRFAAAVVASSAPDLGAPVEAGLLGYDVPGLAVAWLDPPQPRIKARPGQVSAAELVPSPA